MENQSLPHQQSNSSYYQTQNDNTSNHWKTTVIVLFIILVGTLIVWTIKSQVQPAMVSNVTQEEQPAQKNNEIIPTQVVANENKNQQQENSQTVDWLTFTGFEYVIQHPRDTEISTSAGGKNFGGTPVESVKFSYVNQHIPQTEITDGYTLVVTNVNSITETKNLNPANTKQHAFESQSSLKQECDSTSNVETININGVTAYQYIAQGCFNSGTTTYLNSCSNVYRIEQYYAGKDRSKYKNITDSMLNTFTIFSC